MKKYDCSEIKSLIEEGKNYREICNILGCSKGAISYCVHKADDNKIGLQGKKVTKEKIDEINSLYSSGESLHKIRRKTGLAVQTIKKYLTVPKPIKVNKNKSKVQYDYRKKVKQRLVDYKGGSCQRCGYNKCLQALQFHHLDPSKKDFNICGTSLSYDNLRAEADKCILLCSNCHFEEHAKYYNQ